MKKINQSTIEEKWYVVDAKGHRTGRVATIVAELLLGKNNPLVKDYTIPKNKVIVLNADKIDITEKRSISKFFKYYSGYPGGLRVEDLKTTIEKFPTRPLEKAIKGMLPKNTRGREIYRNLFTYASAEHPHEAQKPEIVNIKETKF